VWSGHFCPLAFDFGGDAHDVQSCHTQLNKDAGFSRNPKVRLGDQSARINP